MIARAVCATAGLTQMMQGHAVSTRTADVDVARCRCDGRRDDRYMLWGRAACATVEQESVTAYRPL